MAELPTYAVAVIRDIQFGADMTAYLEGLDATLVPYGGTFVVHGVRPTVVEGELPKGALVIIAFPDRGSAQEWYESPAYQEILPLRTNNSSAIAMLADGVPDGYSAREGLQAMLARAAQRNA